MKVEYNIEWSSGFKEKYKTDLTPKQIDLEEQRLESLRNVVKFSIKEVRKKK